MVTIAAGNLPPPHFIGLVDDMANKRSTVGLLPFVHQPDPTMKPRLLRLTWQDVPGAVADAIDRHYDEHPLAVITVKLPATGATVRVQLVGPPIIQWSSDAFASSVTADAQEVLAYE